VGDKSAIQWTDATWNPVTGCDNYNQARTAKTSAERRMYLYDALVVLENINLRRTRSYVEATCMSEW
jgi:protein gp37